LTLSGASNISAQSKGKASGGEIVINTNNNIELNSLSQISSEAVNSNSGSITINADSVLLNQGLITSSVGRLVDGTPIIKGNAGDITIHGDALIMSDGFIQANTLGLSNHGGAVFIGTDQVVTAYNSLEVGGGFPIEFIPESGRNIIQAAAPEGAPGEILFKSPIDEVNNEMGTVDGRYKKLKKVSKNRCKLASGEIPSSLTLSGKGILPFSAKDNVMLRPGDFSEENHLLQKNEQQKSALQGGVLQEKQMPSYVSMTNHTPFYSNTNCQLE